MKRLLVVVSALLLLPTVVFGVYPEVARGAGFAKQSLFLSKNFVTEGDTVLIHAVVSNDTTTKFTGTLVFEDVGLTHSINSGQADPPQATIGSMPVSIIAGEVDTLSVSWKPSAGSHTIQANLEDKEGAVVEQESATFVIAKKPSPVVAESAFPTPAVGVESSAQIQESIARLSPAVAQSAQPIFSAIDSARTWAAGVLDRGLDYETQRLVQKTNGQVLGTQAQKTATTTGAVQGWTNTLWTIIDTIVLYILSVLRWLVGNAGAFYPALALFFFYLLWRLYKRMRTRP